MTDIWHTGSSWHCVTSGTKINIKGQSLRLREKNVILGGSTLQDDEYILDCQRAARNVRITDA